MRTFDAKKSIIEEDEHIEQKNYTSFVDLINIR